MGDRICVMELGRIKQVDTPIKLYNEPQNKFVAGFIGSPSMNIVEGNLMSENGEVYIVTSDNMKLRLPKEKAAKVESHVGKEVWFGIRPEHIGSYETHPNETDNYIKAEVYVVEQMGNEVFVYFSPGQNQYISRLESGVRVSSGEQYELWFDMSKCHIFDKTTEENISL